jgi:molybdate transport system substrate-binding protein
MKRRCTTSWIRRALVNVALAALCAITLGGCSRPDDPTPPTLLLHCGAGIRPAAKALIEAFEATENVKIEANYAGSGTLLGAISSNGKGDLFMPGAEMYVDRAVEKNLADAESKRVVAYFVPVIFVKKGNPARVESLQDLANESVRVGLGDERSCAIGRKAIALLKKNGIPLADVARNVKFKSETVNTLCVHIELGKIDATVVWDANARQFAKAGDTIVIPPEQNLPSTIPIVRLSGSVAPELADRFIAFVTSEQGKEILRQNGYSVSLDDKQE